MTTRDNTVVFLWRERDAHRRLHQGLGVETQTEDETTIRLLEVAEVNPPSGLVAHLLGVTCFAPNDPSSGVKVTELKPEQVDVMRVLSFKVPERRVLDVLAAMESGMTNGVGGFSAVVLGLTGFHQSHYAFKVAWEAAGAPELFIHGVEVPAGSTGGSAPGSIREFDDLTVLQSLLRQGLIVPS